MLHYLVEQRHLISLSIAVLLLTACEAGTPSCPAKFSNTETNTTQIQSNKNVASAGCLIVQDQTILLVKNSSGKISLPGGSAKPDESAHCTAHRETWEETGLNTSPQHLIRVSDNGFHLYLCALDNNLSKIEREQTSRPFQLEIRRTLWLSATQFNQYQWRFPASRLWLAQWLNENPVD